jgi:hypothetical protein
MRSVGTAVDVSMGKEKTSSHILNIFLGLHEFRPKDFSGRKIFFLLKHRIILTLIFISHWAEISCLEMGKVVPVPVSVPAGPGRNFFSHRDQK